MKKRILVIILSCIFALAFFGACAAIDGDRDWGIGAPGGTYAPNAPPGDDGDLGDALTTNTSPTRLIVYTVDMTIHSQNFGATFLFLRNSLYEGEWFDRQEVRYQGREAILVARVHHERLQDFIDGIISEVGIANIPLLNERATDVSLAHQDRTMRIEEYERRLDWLNDEMERAINRNASFTERSQIQTQINSAQTALNALITAQNTVNQQILFSTVTITLRETDPPPAEEEPSRIAVVFGNVWMVISNILIVLLYIVAALLPFAVPLFFLIRYLVKRNKEKRKQLAFEGGSATNTPPPYNYPPPPHGYYPPQQAQPQQTAQSMTVAMPVSESVSTSEIVGEKPQEPVAPSSKDKKSGGKK